LTFGSVRRILLILMLRSAACGAIENPGLGLRAEMQMEDIVQA
jgi:hypothetical protein